MTVYFHSEDIPGDIEWGNCVAVDTETQGLSLVRDRLCLVQISAGDGDAHIVQPNPNNFDCPRLKAVLADPNCEKIFHYARFDIAVIKRDLNVEITSLFCTKIASKLVRTYTDRHGLKEVAREIAGVELSKQQQSSDWAANELTKAQLNYAASDVLHLHVIKSRLTEMLKREHRLELARKCFDFLPVRANLDLAGWGETDIFSHS